MKNELDNYFMGRLSASQEAEIQKMLCSGEGQEEIDSAMRDIFDSCCRKASARPAFFRVLPYALAAAAAIALVVCLPLSFRSGRQEGERRISSIEWVEESVPLGQTRVLTLADGSVLHLNAGSRVTYPKEFTGDTRNVFMSGEAFLDVARDPEHPFVVSSSDVKITVLGTSFNYKNFPESRNVELLLMEGKVNVAVSTPDGIREVRLSPGDKMRYNRVDGMVDLTRFSPDNYKAFYEDNSLHFFDVEMSDIAKELSRHFNQEIVVMDRKLASRRYFAIFTNNETLDDVLAAMNSDGRMAISRSKGIVYLQSK